MKRLLSIILTATMVAVFSSCTKKINDNPPPETAFTDTEAYDVSEALTETEQTGAVSELGETQPSETEGEILPPENELPRDNTHSTIPPTDDNTIDIDPPNVNVSVTYEHEFYTPKNENIEVDPNRKNYDMGTCRKFYGDIDVYLFFMDDDESSWTNDHAKSFINNEITPALDYIELEAKQWGKSLHFNTPEIYVTGGDKGFNMKYGGIINDYAKSSIITDILDQAARCIGYISSYELFDLHKDKTGSDNAIFLTLVNKDGRSYSNVQSGTKIGMYPEHCVIFNELQYDQYGNTYGDTFRSSYIAHEILHLYGAEDYYMGSREPIASEVYPDDIMFQVYTDINYNQIGDCTAFTIGWTDAIPAVCNREGWDDWWYD